MSIDDAMRVLYQHKARLTVQELKTLHGQVRAGDTEGAMRGLDKILQRRKAKSGA